MEYGGGGIDDGCRCPKEAPGLFPLRVLYYASPPGHKNDGRYRIAGTKKTAELSGAEDRFWILVGEPYRLLYPLSISLITASVFICYSGTSKPMVFKDLIFQNSA